MTELSHKLSVRNIVSVNRLRNIGQAEKDQAVSQLAAGELFAVVERRLCDWDHEIRRESHCDSVSSASIEDRFYS